MRLDIMDFQVVLAALWPQQLTYLVAAAILL
jgi:hypothetical protein